MFSCCSPSVLSSEDRHLGRSVFAVAIGTLWHWSFLSNKYEFTAIVCTWLFMRRTMWLLKNHQWGSNVWLQRFEHYFGAPNIFFRWHPTKAASDNQLDVEIANAGNDSPKAEIATPKKTVPYSQVKQNGGWTMNKGYLSAPTIIRVAPRDHRCGTQG